MKNNKKPLTVDAITGKDFVGKTVSDIQWLPDSSSFTFTRGSSIYRHNVKTNQETLLVDTSTLKCNGKEVDMSEYHTTGHQNHLLLTGTQKKIWRYSFAAPYYIYDTETKNIFAVAGGDDHLQNVQLSPDNKYVAFVKASNLYVASTEKESDVKQLTSDGSDNVLNGIFDWVYEEEFGRADAFRWSPDATKIAFWWTDQTRVKSFIIYDDTSERYAKTTTLKYPKVGESNAIVKIGVVDVQTGNTTWIDIGKPEDDIYIPRIHWTTSSQVLSLQRLNRKQNVMELLFADVNTGKTKVVFTDETKTGWIDITDDFIFFKKKDEFIWSSERDGARQIYHSDYSGKILRQLTSGPTEITSVLGFDEERGFIYFYGKYHGIQHQLVYRINIGGGEEAAKPELVSHASGWVNANFSTDYSYYVADRSTADTPNQFFLFDSSGKQLYVLEENKIPAFDEYEFNFASFSDVTISDGDDAQGSAKITLSSFMIKPPNFDPNKKYPVLVFGYSGPASQVVIDRWIRLRVLWHSLIASKGCLVFCVDHRGTSGRGALFKHMAYGDLSKYAVMDQIKAVEYLRTLPYVDASRIGFWGWSGGGYLSCMLLTRGADYFKCGIAVAPVSDFRNYDTIWTERYMGLLSENLKGYEAADVLTYASGLKGPLLLVHGSGDDNVHPQNTMMLVEKLISLDKDFEMMIYPNRNHGIYGNNATRHLFRMTTKFLERHLLL